MVPHFSDLSPRLVGTMVSNNAMIVICHQCSSLRSAHTLPNVVSTSIKQNPTFQLQFTSKFSYLFLAYARMSMHVGMYFTIVNGFGLVNWKLSALLVLVGKKATNLWYFSPPSLLSLQFTFILTVQCCFCYCTTINNDFVSSVSFNFYFFHFHLSKHASSSFHTVLVRHWRLHGQQ